ncbi:MAG: choice-of-anchor D domain-containing protein [Myxococcales bacterium]|nr:choice-of-anchor D domain-containing protein [Myxococcales bacterium]MCB9643367.1 choice-of-anchor D domain-containing protein [Myxococcales bacterium]
MRRREGRWLSVWVLLGCFLAISFAPGCQCGVMLRTDPEIGPRQLKTDLPEGLLVFDQGQRFNQTRPFLVYNDGTMPLHVISFGVIDDADGVFEILESPSQQKPFTLAPTIKEAVPFSVRFRARRPGSYSARLRFFAPSADNADEDGYVYLRLQGVRDKFGPLFDCGETLDFGEVSLGATKELTCEVQNIGTAPLLINGFKYKVKEGNTPIDFAWLGPELPLRIPPDTKGVMIRIVYRPTDLVSESDEGVYILETNLPAESDEEKPQIAVRGKTIAPKIALLPMYPACAADVDCQIADVRLACRDQAFLKTKHCQTPEDQNPLMKFPRTLVGKSVRQSFIVLNEGNAPLEVKGLTWSADASADFALALPFAPFTLQPGKSRTIEVLYKPSDNNKDKGQLRVSSNSYDKPEALIDVEAAAIGCKLAIDPQKIEFAKAETHDVVLRNEGDEMCQIKSATLRFKQTQVFALQNIPDPRDLIAPNASRTMQVQHTIDPKATPDIVDVLSNDFERPNQEVVLIPVIPRPEKCALIANPTILNFQIVQPGQDKTLKATFFNIGRVPCRVTAMTTSGTTPAGHTAFSLATPPKAPFDVAVGSALSLDVLYAPTQQVNYEGILQLDTPDGESANTQVLLRGAYGSPCLEVVPRLVDFGASRFTCAARDQRVHVYHVGATGCPTRINIQNVRIGGQTSQAFSLKGTNPVIPRTGLNLTSGQSVEITVGYRPTQVGADHDNLEIFHSFVPQSPMSVPLEGTGVLEDEQTDVFIQRNTPMVDILFVVDNSCSMRGEQQNLADNFVSFINWASRLNVDYHIGVTTTDISGRSGTPGCLHEVTDAQNQKHRYLKISTPTPLDVFEKMANVGTRGSGSEQGLEGAYRALTPPVRDSFACNYQFYRDDASLSLVFVSDEEDQSPKTYNFYLNFFQNIKGVRNANLVRASAIVGPPPGGCRNSGSSVSARSAQRYWDMAGALRGERASICSADWAKTLSKLGAVSFGLLEQFFLTRNAEESSIQVKVDGKPAPQGATNGWVYERSSNSIIFATTARPPAGARIEVSYKAICN